MPVTSNLDREDLYSQEISGVYVTLVTVQCGESKFYLNDGGVAFTFNEHEYIPAAFSVSEAPSVSGCPLISSTATFRVGRLRRSAGSPSRLYWSLFSVRSRPELIR